MKIQRNYSPPWSSTTSALEILLLLLGLGVPGAIALPCISLTTQCPDTTVTKLWSLCSDRDNTPNQHSLPSRRDAFATLMTSGFTSTGLIAGVAPAAAASPVTLGETEGLGARAERAFRPKPPKLLRPKLERDFAVLLMRSSYSALDKLDCVAMDQFQRDFFFIRQSEYQPYVNNLGVGAVQQGDLTDANYFDFISFAQYATISREISQDPPSVFEEQQPVEVGENEPQKFVTKVVKRDPTLTNDMLAARHSSLVGAAILDRLEEVFGSTDAAIPKIDRGSRPNAETLLASVSQLVKLFLINGYAFDGSTMIISSADDRLSASGTQLCIAMNSPANLWSGKALQKKGSDPVNDFVLKVSRELLLRAGYTISKSLVKYEGNQEKTYITLR